MTLNSQYLISSTGKDLMLLPYTTLLLQTFLQTVHQNATPQNISQTKR